MLSILIVIPLWYYQTIPSGWEELSRIFVGELPERVPPSPPQPVQPASGARVRATGPIVFRVPELVEPSDIPPPPDAQEIEMRFDQIGLGTETRIGTGPHVPGVIGGPGLNPGVLLGDGPRTPPPPPPKPPKQPMLISSLDPSRLIYRVEPVYPPLAMKARVEGVVMLQVTVNEMGVVESVEVASGHPLLVKAAVDAVSQWRYKPTILNGEPVPVKATVTVNFNLHR